MSHDSQQAISHVLQQDSKVLDTLLQKTRQLAQLQQILSQHLDQKISKHCQVANLDNGALIILTDSAPWATQFRFQISDLLPKLRQHPEFHHLKHIQCKIRPQVRHIPDAPEAPMRSLSPATAEIILAAADSIKHDRLKTIMEKIAHHTTQRRK